MATAIINAMNTEYLIGRLELSTQQRNMNDQRALQLISADVGTSQVFINEMD